MKVVFFLVILILTTNIFAQTKELNVDHYENGQIHWSGYDTCILTRKKAAAVKNCHSYGLWEYWYENGLKKLQTFYNPQLKFLNMWLPDGQQILFNGIGFYYCIEPSGGNDKDSLFFQIQDSIKQGIFNRYRFYSNDYVLVESGQYINKHKTGIWYFRDSSLNIFIELTYLNDKENGPFKSFYSTGKLKETGYKLNGMNDSIWKYYDENGQLVKECGFKADYKYGKYKEYYTNGHVKAEGQYVHITGYKMVYSEDPTDPGRIHKHKFISNDIVAMDGEWKYYSNDGKLIKTKVYNKKRVHE